MKTSKDKFSRIASRRIHGFTVKNDTFGERTCSEISGVCFVTLLLLSLSYSYSSITAIENNLKFIFSFH